MTDLTATLDRLVARARQFYTLPSVAMKVLELTRNPQVDTHALKECIENDPALTCKVLRVVNSSLFGLSREVSDLNQALALLGSKPLKLLVLGFSLPNGLFSGVAAHTLGWYWRHALTKAVSAREISETAWGQPGDEAFLAGLLQDLGLLLLIQEVGTPYVEFLERVISRGCDLLAMETEVLGFDHTMLTARLLAHWNLPESLVETVRWQAGDCPDFRREAGENGTVPFGPPQPRLPRIVHLAEFVARLVADNQCGALGDLLALGGREHDLAPEQWRALIDSLEEKVRQLADVLSLQLPRGLDYREVLNRAHAQLAEVAASAAADLVRHRQLAEAVQSNAAQLAEESRALTTAIASLSQRPLEPAAPPAPRPAAVAMAALAEAASARTPPLSPFVVAEADPGLLGRLAASVAACRQARRSLSLLLVALDHADELVVTFGVEGFNHLRDRLHSACWDLDHPGMGCLSHGEAGFALVLPDCERTPAVQLGYQLIDRIRGWSPGWGSPGRRPPALAVGAATVSLPPKNFPPADLLAGAARCLCGSLASGGGVVKSIEIY